MILHITSFILDTLFELKDTENALKAFKQGHNLTPSDPIITANTALLSSLLGLMEDSGEFIQKFDTLCEEGQSITREVSDHFRHAFTQIVLSNDKQISTSYVAPS